MKVSLAIRAGQQTVLFEMKNVTEDEYQELTSEIYGIPTEDPEYTYTFAYDGGLGELTFKPFCVEAVFANRSEP